ncbi:hypothetical protein U1Q18_051333, partial [Sarracenia purpurea var. burkii]
MNFYLCLLTAVVGCIGIDACEHYGDARCLEIKPIEGRHFLNQWIVEIHGGADTAKLVARDTGFRFMEPVIRVGQQYVWKPTLNQLEDYKEFVGMERPINVMVSTFDPKERLAYYEEIMNRSIQPVYEDEIRITIENDDRAVAGNGAVSKLQPLDNYIDLQ